MEALQRSAVSFRRSGSSGLVWDDKLLTSELNQLGADQKNDDKKPQQETKNEDAATDSAAIPSRPSGLKIDRSRSNGGRGFRTGKVPASIDPPSPKLSACSCCNPFGKTNKTRRRPPKSGKRVM